MAGPINPMTMAMIGAAGGAVLNKDDPLKGAALGAAGGFAGGHLMGAMGGAAGAGGNVATSATLPAFAGKLPADAAQAMAMNSAGMGMPQVGGAGMGAFAAKDPAALALANAGAGSSKAGLLGTASKLGGNNMMLANMGMGMMQPPQQQQPMIAPGRPITPGGGSFAQISPYQGAQDPRFRYLGGTARNIRSRY